MLVIKKFIQSRVAAVKTLGGSLSVRVLSLLAMMVLCIAEPALAQTFDLPQVDIEGVDENTPPTEMVWLVFKFAVQFILWALVVISGVVLIKNVLKSIAKVRRDEDGKWGDVAAESMGNAIVVILLIALSTGVTTWLN